MLDHFNLRVLVHSEILWPKDETHVYGDKFLFRVYPILWDAGALDRESGISLCARLLDLQYLFGLFQAPYYAYAQTMMSEVTPRGYENMFFGLFGQAVKYHRTQRRSGNNQRHER
jgi:hypothetical protein